ncbi:MAG: disulfide bond formation protein DsbD [Alphaproteobacteria bacterium]|nr:disulfide bond formation protein DsbD [Alphaproteobacteria bacterium]
MNIKFFSLFLLFFVFCAAASPVSAFEPTKNPQVQTRLLADHAQVTKGQTFDLVFEQKITLGWHTYWVNAGDSGSAPGFTWKKPEAITIGDVQWPVPKRIPMEPLLNYGYEGTAHLVIPVTVPADFTGRKVSLAANVEWLVCHDICIPEYATFALEVPVGKEPVLDEENKNVFETARANLPAAGTDFASSFAEKKGKFAVNFCLPSEAAEKIKKADEIYFFPREWGLLNYAAKPEVKWKESTLTLLYPRETRDLNEITTLNGILSYTTDDLRAGYQIAATEMMDVPKSQPEGVHGLWQALLYAFLGGLILNLMPCVFPVLSLKALSFAKLAEHHETGKARLYAVGYTLGVLISFMALAGILVALKSAGAQIGWGFQLQEPIVVYVLALIMFAVGLNLSGFFEISFGVENAGHKLTQKEGVAGSFFTGLLATLVATPCTAPFMAGALGFALVQPAHVGMAVFAALGLGLAFPILLLGFIPALQKIMPRPGMWMERFKQFLAFPLYLFIVWLVWVLAQQAGANAVGLLFIGMVKLAFVIWLLKLRPVALFAKSLKWLLVIASVIVLLLIPLQGLKPMSTVMPAITAQSVPSQSYPHTAFTREAFNAALGGENALFVDMTAAWCISCKVNEKVALQTKKTYKLFSDKNVQLFIGDWTNRNPEITAYLQEFNRSGVPLYVYYPAPVNGIRPPPKVLPQILTPGIVASTLE